MHIVITKKSWYSGKVSNSRTEPNNHNQIMGGKKVSAGGLDSDSLCLYKVPREGDLYTDSIYNNRRKYNEMEVPQAGKRIGRFHGDMRIWVGNGLVIGRGICLVLNVQLGHGAWRTCIHGVLRPAAAHSNHSRCRWDRNYTELAYVHVCTHSFVE